MRKYFIFGSIFLALILPAIGMYASTSGKSIDDEVNEMQVLFFTGSYEQGVRFDSDAAKKAGYSDEAINVVTEISEINTQVINLSKKRKTLHSLNDISTSSTGEIDISKYKKFGEYMNGVKKRKEKEQEVGFVANAGAFDATVICGSFNNPKPTTAAPRTSYDKGTQSAAISYLISLGFHQISDTYGGGYTRPQSRNSRICGVGSFRDDARLVSGGRFSIQDYSGWNPRGEPNPEISAYTWPYLAWPSYVYWWHQNH